MRNTNLIQARNKKGFTQRQVAEKAQIAESAYQFYELGKREPRVRTANRIADILESTAKHLFGT